MAARISLTMLSKPPPGFAAYGTPGIFDLAASYRYGIVKNYPFATAPSGRGSPPPSRFSS
jgi:hypothetical protein